MGLPEGWNEHCWRTCNNAVLCVTFLHGTNNENVTKISSSLKQITSLCLSVTDSMTTVAPIPEEEEEESSGVEDILQVFRIFKLARVLKLARHSPGLQAIAYTLQNSYKELGLLIFLVCISGFIFASLCYFIEIDQDSGFTSIPTAFYWVVITMTTVGYGDISPVTGETLLSAINPNEMFYR